MDVRYRSLQIVKSAFQENQKRGMDYVNSEGKKNYIPRLSRKLVKS
jgi:hypothetical protein